MNPLQKLFSNNNIPIFMAPMAGITDAPFRELIYSFGASAVVSEMISSEALIRNNKKTQKRLPNKDNDDFLKIIQIVGANPDHMAESAKINEQMGADVIDINMGCPAKKIIGNDSGSALMKNEKLAISIVKSIVKSVKIPITLKMRLGWDNENINFIKLAKIFEEEGIQMLAIHCRTRAQMYSGSANWSILKQLKEIINIPYLCNGDIKTIIDAENSLKESNANGLMIGRGALGKPWFIKHIMDYINYKKTNIAPSISEQLSIIHNHFNNVLNFYGNKAGVKIFRKHFCWYSIGLNGASKFRVAINEMEDVNMIKDHLNKFYEKQGN